MFGVYFRGWVALLEGSPKDAGGMSFTMVNDIGCGLFLRVWDFRGMTFLEIEMRDVVDLNRVSKCYIQKLNWYE